MIDIIGTTEACRQLDTLQGLVERHHSDRQAKLVLEWLLLRFPAGNTYRPLVLGIADAVTSFGLHSWHDADGVSFGQVVEVIDRMRQAIRDDPQALHIAAPREQPDFADALSALGLYNWHDPDEYACVFSSGVPGTTGHDLSARMIVHRDGRAVLEIEVARLVEWAAWPTLKPVPQ